MSDHRVSELWEMVAEARRSLRRMKRHSPHLFPQWQELQQAKADVRRAKSRLKSAQIVWEALARDGTA